MSDDTNIQDHPERGPDRRKSVVDTRTPQEQAQTGLERRRGPGRRRSDFMKQAEEGEMTPEQFLFIKAIDAYKRGKPSAVPDVDRGARGRPQARLPQDLRDDAGGDRRGGLERVRRRPRLPPAEQIPLRRRVNRPYSPGLARGRPGPRTYSLG